MQTSFAGELGVKRHRNDVALPDGHRMAVDGGEHLDVGACPGDPWGADEDCVDGGPGDALQLEVGLEGTQLAPERVALRDDVEHPEMVAVEHDHPGTRAEHRSPRLDEVEQRPGQPLAFDAERHHGRLAAGDDHRVEPLKVGGDTDLARVGAERAKDLRVRLEVALEREDAHALSHLHRSGHGWPTSRETPAAARPEASRSPG